VLRAEAPNLFSDFSMKILRDGMPMVLHSNPASGQPPQ
jgi:hypothetical protein